MTGAKRREGAGTGSKEHGARGTGHGARRKEQGGRSLGAHFLLTAMTFSEYATPLSVANVFVFCCCILSSLLSHRNLSE